MKMARILYPVNVLGPGDRIALWLSGCPHKCANCINPDLWEQHNDQEMSLSAILAVINAISKKGPVDGFVFTGGDPMYQAKELSILLPMIRVYSNDILVYTGYEYEQLMSFADQSYKDCLKSISVLIDGRYIDDLNDGTPLRGSSNQRIIFLKDKIERKYMDYLSHINTNETQQFLTSGGFISVGIHHKGFQKELQEKAKERGVIIHV